MAARNGKGGYLSSNSSPMPQMDRFSTAPPSRVMQPPSSESPRPSSVGSAHSTHSSTNFSMKSGSGKSKNDICVGEEVKIGVNIALERFRLSEEQKVLEFPSSLTSTERAYVHRYCQTLGLKSKSKGKGANRYLTVTKKDGSQTSQSAAVFHLVRNSRHQIHSLIQRFPVTNKERQDLQPRTERNQYNEVLARELNKTTTGRLNNGVPQIPPARGSSDLTGFRQSLPVNSMRNEIMKAILSNKVVLIAGDTGCGKTTQVPQMILDDCHANHKACRIFCTQPRRISALSVAERVAIERGEKIGQTVGYQIRLESRVSPKTLLTFCTNGVLLRTLMGGDNALSTVTHVIIDEVHERDRFSDFLLIAMKDLLPRYKNLKLVLMSATLNLQLFTAYFEGCPVIGVPGKTYEVQQFLLEDVLKQTGYTNKEMEKYKRGLEKVSSKQRQLDDWYTKEPTTEKPRKELDPLEEQHSMSNLSINDGDKMVELGQEKDDLEPWLTKEMDTLLSDAWLTGDEEIFTQVFHFIMSENVSVDYMHTETSATPLMIAAGRGFFTVVEQLLNLGANVLIRASNDWTALDWARKFEHIDIIELLEAHLASTTTVQNDEALLIKKAQTISAEERELLNVYHHSFDDEKVDIDLMLALIYKLHSSTQEGAILVFLPGYDEIVTMRDRILEEKRFSDGNRYILYTLHSSMQSTDQRKVFKTPPQGVRKIILSTNIAETSITINDVVFVVDSGKVKEKSFDALTSVSMLKTQWISKSSALQRKGRAGRCRPGVCYHMFSKVRYDSMMEYQTPEILRYPLQELCLHTKLLAPVNCPIGDFLAKAPEPPASLITRNAVHLLKQTDALDPFEDLTELGHHLADLPIEPRFGKMILYSVVLKCLDPVLTVACALAYKDPFLLPAQPYLKRASAMSRRKFSAGTHSDHMALLRAFQAWQKARTDGWERSFCDKNFLSAATMEMIVGMRTQLLGQLRASGFVRARGGGDIRDLNTNSENWAVVKAALCAGMYPNVIRVDREKCQLTTSKENKVRFHASSVLSPPPSSIGSNAHAQAVHKLPTDWLVYEEMTRTHRLAQVKCSTLVSPITVAIFAGPAKLSFENIKEAEGNPMHIGQGDGITTASSDSEVEEKEETRKATLRLDEWISFRIDTEASNLAIQLRQKWHSLFLRRMRAPSKPWSQVDESVIRAVIGVLTNEEQSLGLQQPAGIGQRPKPMATDQMMSSVGGSRRGSYDTEHSDDSSNGQAEGNKSTPPSKGRPFKFITSPKKKDFGKYKQSDGDRSETSSVRSNSSAPGSTNNSATNSLGGSEASSPCNSPQPSSPSKWADTESGPSAAHPCRYYVMKCNSYRNLDVSMQKGIWATNTVNEKKMNKVFKDGKIVYLIFSVQGSGHFQGFAKLTSPSQIGMEKVKEFSAPGVGNQFRVEWGKRANLPFQQCHHLLNPWNENKKVQISRDGQEIEPAVGEQLIKLWDKLQPFVPKSSPLAGKLPRGNLGQNAQDASKHPGKTLRGPGPEHMPSVPQHWSPRGQDNKPAQGHRQYSSQGNWSGPGSYQSHSVSGASAHQGGSGYGSSSGTPPTPPSTMPVPHMNPSFNPMYATQAGNLMFSNTQSNSSGQNVSPIMILQRTNQGSVSSPSTQQQQFYPSQKNQKH